MHELSFMRVVCKGLTTPITMSDEERLCDGVVAQNFNVPMYLYETF